MNKIILLSITVILSTGCSNTKLTLLPSQVAEQYITAPKHKAFSRGIDGPLGAAGAAWGEQTQEEAIKKSLDICNQSGMYIQKCKVVSVDGKPYNNTSSNNNKTSNTSRNRNIQTTDNHNKIDNLFETGSCPRWLDVEDRKYYCKSQY